MSFAALHLLIYVLLLGLIAVVGWCASSMDRSLVPWVLLALFSFPILAAMGLLVVGEGAKTR